MTHESHKLPPGRAMDVAGMVQYADGSVVSRTLADCAGGSMTLFAFEAGQGLSEHTTPFDAVVQVLDGEAELMIGGESVSVSAGQVALMPAHVPHAVAPAGRFKMLLTMLRSKPAQEQKG